MVLRPFVKRLSLQFTHTKHSLPTRPSSKSIVDIESYNPNKHFARLQWFSPSLLKPFFPSEYEFGPGGLRRTRNMFERIFLILTDTDSSRLSVIVSSFVMLVIFMSCVMFVLETVPSMNVYSTQCDMCKPLRGDDYDNEELRANRSALATVCSDCEPQPLGFFATVEVFSISVFTVEYLIRILTVAFLPSPQERAVSFTFQWPPGPKRAVKRILYFMFSFMNLVDLVAILPFYLGALSLVPAGTKLSVVRVIRLFRVFRVLKMGRLSEGVSLFLGVINLSLTSFSVFLLFSAFGMVIFASLVFYVEGGKWDPATGEYMRESVYYLAPDEPSPFVSIPRAFWWVLVTFATVGYGDMYPTTTAGRTLGAMAMYMGVVLIAMPITIMGVNLADLYQQDTQKRARELRVRKYTAIALHTIILSKRVLPQRRAWNEWKEFVREMKRQEETVEGVLEVEVARMVQLVKQKAKTGLALTRGEDSLDNAKISTKLVQAVGVDDLDSGVTTTLVDSNGGSEGADTNDERERLVQEVEQEVRRVRQEIVAEMQRDLERLREEIRAMRAS